MVQAQENMIPDSLQWSKVVFKKQVAFQKEIDSQLDKHFKEQKMDKNMMKQLSYDIGFSVIDDGEKQQKFPAICQCVQVGDTIQIMSTAGFFAGMGTMIILTKKQFTAFAFAWSDDPSESGTIQPTGQSLVLNKNWQQTKKLEGKLDIRIPHDNFFESEQSNEEIPITISVLISCKITKGIDEGEYLEKD